MVQSGLLAVLPLAGVQMTLGFAVNMSLGIRPEMGDKLPPFAKTMAGCSCKWNDPDWTCTGSIAYPRQLQGESCCCCSVGCKESNRCKDEACMAIGVNQKRELEEERKRIEELLKGADMLIGDDVPAFAVDLGQGRCDQNRIINGCRKKGLTPLCDHTSYARGQCWSPGRSGTKFHNRHFSHWGSHRQYFGIKDDYKFYGMCFFANNPNALAPCNGDSHCWTNGNHRLSPNSRVLASGKVPNIHFNEISSCNGGLGCWRTLCVKNRPNNLR